MTRITENHIELLAIERLEALGYEYIYGPDIAPDSETPERSSFEQVLLPDRLQQAVRSGNPILPPNAAASRKM